ncbi:hypothetical protein FV226_24405 [Methylobacterium sp. WL12]|uniref:hypothetical protein n=1 Tax=Methylobacterium sp. WL12 TaxID=2603890 RepID=UPI0011C97549|nr:hypothetical protein [Methylobacterium sp. WL12]TXM65826.1 hypothetical protein FV226_24405 [Methylobacterium sp. WL12]
MTTISPFAAGTYVNTRSTSQLLSLKGQLDTLSTQLSTGRTAETYAGLGAGRSTSLTARGTLSALDGYDAGIASAQTRVTLASTSLQQIAKLTADLRGGIASNLQPATGTTVTPQLAQANLDGALDALNQNAAGQYLFGGRATDAAPVKSTDVILNGDKTTTPPQDGLVTLVAEQKAADLGTGGLGRLQLGAVSAGNAFQLSEDQGDATGETRANFGFRIAGKPATTGAITATVDPAHTGLPATVTGLDHAPMAGESFRVTVNLADGSQKSYDLTASSTVPAGSTTAFGVFATPAAAAAGLNAFAIAQGGTVASVQSGNTPALNATFGNGTYAAYDIGLSGQPAAGDSITVQLALHDGSTTSVTLTAGASVSTGSTTTFAIGADVATTTANLKAALGTALAAAAAGPLSASSTTRASEDFFSASNASGQAPKRIDTTGATPTYKDAASTSTVIWYQGDAANTDPRATASIRAGANLDVAIGARANEVPIRKALAGFAALAVDGLADPKATTTPGRLAALSSKTYDLLGKASNDPSLEAIATDFGLAASTLTSAKSQNAATRLTLQNVVDGVESAPIQEVAAKLLEVQNRLQASYQITSSLSKLSLVNYMS